MFSVEVTNVDKVGQGGGLVEEGKMIKVFQKDGKIQLENFAHKMREYWDMLAITLFGLCVICQSV